MARRSRFAVISLVALALLVAVGETARAEAATPGEVSAYSVPACSARGYVAARRYDLAPAPGEGVLLRLCKKKTSPFSSTLGHLLPDGTLLRRRVPKSEPGAILAGPAGEVWLASGSERSAAAKGAELSIDRIAPDGSAETFPLGSAREPFDALSVRGLVADGAGALWVAVGKLKPDWVGMPADSGGGELVHIAADGTVTRFTVPGEVEPEGLALGPDGNLWFTGVSGRYFSEHGGSSGTGYVGRMTPTGSFDLHPLPVEDLDPGSIALGPDGRLWFVESGYKVHQLGTIGVDGAFGPGHPAPFPFGDALAFGPEGNPWFPANGGVARMTPTGQVTVYPLGGPSAYGFGVVLGLEGDIWSLGGNRAKRVVPGGPGIEITELTVDRASSTATVDLACGGSESGCAGTLDLDLRNRHEDSRKPKTERSRFRFLETAYTVAPESSATLSFPIPAKTFASAKPGGSRRGVGRSFLRAIAKVTVVGGPTAEGSLQIPISG